MRLATYCNYFKNKKMYSLFFHERKYGFIYIYIYIYIDTHKHEHIQIDGEILH